jgi:mycothiol synthase
MGPTKGHEAAEGLSDRCPWNVGPMATKVKPGGEAITIRPFQPEDFPPVVEIANLLFPEHPTTVEEERFDDESFDKKRYVYRRYAAVESSGTVVGSASFNHQPSAFDPRRFGMWVGVHPRWHGKGIGTALYEHLLEQLRTFDAVALRTWVRETMETSTRWIRRRGFRELSRGWESRLDLPSFDLSRFAGRWALPAGIEVVSLAEELRRDSDSIQGLYELDCEISPDEPRPDPYTRPSFEMFHDRVLKSPDSSPESILLAREGSRYVGLTELYRNVAIPTDLRTGFTGVRREYRGRGLAFALKLRAIDWAKRSGYKSIRTWNSTLNAPMLGINVKLGFARQPAWITFGKDLGEG